VNRESESHKPPLTKVNHNDFHLNFAARNKHIAFFKEKQTGVNKGGSKKMIAAQCIRIALRV